MSLESDIAKFLRENKRTWHLDTGHVIPTEEDVERLLDEAARVLYNEKPGAELEVGGLIIKKLHKGHDVYVYFGPYE